VFYNAIKEMLLSILQPQDFILIFFLFISKASKLLKSSKAMQKDETTEK